MENQNFLEIQHVLDLYFEGVYRGDIERLKQAFHPKALLFGEVNQSPYFKTLEEYLDIIKNRESPAELREEFNMEAYAIEILGSLAIAKASLRMLNYDYRDFLSLVKLDGRWQIVNKSFTNI
ncbi:nuclear transport factor 2 family protein [Desertivirga brevis]|uniref:nuclear transport factor 2 family protein n=1 Tax=Desertivirga brevis TaxID=2810310 RepID=UPI001A976A9D|nr:nuclear transport factor 2 family protein [Pedobacter sp. SYSU D00873]